MSEYKQIFDSFSPEMKAKIKQASIDMALSALPTSVSMINLRNAMIVNVEALINLFQSMNKILRTHKQRGHDRHYFITHGKHGMKRPR
jgi:hypothetical protein